MKQYKYPNIAAERTRRGMSLEDLARAINVSRKTLYNWETKGHIPPDKVNELSELFQVTSEYLLQSE